MPDTREKLIEVFTHIGDHITYREEYGLCFDSSLAKAIEDVLAMLKSGVTIQRWIPVSERLPEEGVWVLCWYEYFRFGDYNRMFQTYGIGYYFRDGMWGGEVSNGQNARVLAWMPLPEPPKGE